MLLSFCGFAQTVAFWDFNSDPADGSTATGTLNPVIGTGTITLLGGITNTFATGNPNDPSGDNSGVNTTSYPAQGMSPLTAGLQFDVSTAGYNNIVVEFEQRLSNTANNTYVLQYTLDNTGVSTGGIVDWFTAQVFTFTPAPTGTGDTWHSRSYDFSAIAGLNNNPTAGFRVVSDFDPVAGTYLAARSTSTYSGGGTVRFDLFTVKEKTTSVSIASASNVQIVNEDAGTISIPITTTGANTADVELEVQLVAYSSAVEGTDFNWTSSNMITIPASYNGISNFEIDILDDMLAERTETVIVKIVPISNAVVHASNYYQIIYVKDNDYQAPVPTNELNLSLLSSFSNGAPSITSAEIVAYDSTNFRLYVANSIDAKLDIIDFANPAALTMINSVDISSYGNINSVAVHDGNVVLAIENTNAQLNGFIVFLDADGNFVNQVDAGAMPDMITFNKDFTKVITANEGEPDASYTVDPEGSVTIVDLTPGIASLTNANATTISLTSYNGQEAALLAAGVRIFSTSASVAQDLEPEYVAVSDDNTKAYITLQENNAVLVIDLTTNTILDLYALGSKDYSNNNDWLDASDQSGQILIGSVPVKGFYMPDALAYSTINGQGYLFTANEGDAREFGSVVDAKRISSMNLDPTVFTDQAILKNNKYLGRLNALQYSGDAEGDGDFDEIHVLGGRSFSVWDAITGTLVYDSKDLIEQAIAADPVYGQIFNASNSTGAPSLKNRSDDKGPEPEGVTTAEINGKHYLFLALERIGGVMVFNIENPASPVYVGYYNNRSLAGAPTDDLGSEGIIHISASASPNGNELVILANEVSSTLSIYQINTCAEVAGAVVSANQTEFCAGDEADLSIAGAGTTTVQWFNGSVELMGETANSLTVQTPGDYKVYFESSAFACSDTSNAVTIVVNALPTVDAGSDLEVCIGEDATLSASGTATTYAWDNSVVDATPFTPSATMTYTLTGTDDNGCENTDDVEVVVNALPTIDAGTDFAVCDGEEATLTASGTATNYAWDNMVVDATPFTPTATMTYTLTGTDANGCENTDDVEVVVNALPTVDAGTDFAVCDGEEATLTASGTATNYVWDNSVVDATPFTPSTTMTYTLTGTDANGCENTDDVEVVVNSLPTVDAGADFTVCEGTNNVTLNATGSLIYSWSNGVTNGVTFTQNLGTIQYTLTGVDANNCEGSDQISVTVEDCAGLEDLTLVVEVYPNPFNSNLTIVTEVEVQVTLIDMYGKSVETVQLPAGTNILSTLELANGVYTLLLEGQDGQTSIKRMVKQ